MVALACNQDTPSTIVVSNGVVYWTDYDTGGSVMSVPTSGGVPHTIAANQDYPWNLAVDDNNVYWTNYNNVNADTLGGSTQNAALLQTSLAGGTITTLAMGLETPFGIAVDATDVYWTAFATDFVKKVPIGGGTVTILANSLNGPTYITASGGEVYWTDYGGGTVKKTSTTIGAPTSGTVLVPAADNYFPLGLAVNGSSVYFAANSGGPNSGEILSVPTGGGTVTTIAAGQIQGGPWALTTDATNVYWTNVKGATNNGSLYLAPLAGCGTSTSCPTDLTPGTEGIDAPTGVAVDADGVYVTGTGPTPTSATGHIWRISPP
jgi:hypothetical protein